MGMVEDISLVDGSFPRQCGIPQCDVRKLTVEEAIQWRFFGPPDVPPEIEMKNLTGCDHADHADDARSNPRLFLCDWNSDRNETGRRDSHRQTNARLSGHAQENTR
jgi:hypothetical protein